jgi:hypothetical protein
MPFSQPETENIRKLHSERQVTNLITNHTDETGVVAEYLGPAPVEGAGLGGTATPMGLFVRPAGARLSAAAQLRDLRGAVG